MGYSRSTIVNTLSAWINAKEGDVIHKGIVNIYNNGIPKGWYKLKYTDPWCAATVSAAAMASNCAAIFPIECSCNRMITVAQKMGIWVENDAYVPSTGDLIMYDWQDDDNGDNIGQADHVGLVVSCDGTTIKVIEGNKSNRVDYRTLKVNGKYIRGFITPKYTDKAVANSMPTNASITAPSASVKPAVQLKTIKYPLLKKSYNEKNDPNYVKLLQVLLNIVGFKLDVDGSFGPLTLEAVKTFQAAKGLLQDGEVGPNTWGALNQK